MALIEGVGDEVTIFVTVLALLIVLLLAWVSTGVADRPLVSVIVLDGRTFQHFISRLRGRRVVRNSSQGETSAGTSQNSSPTESTAPVPAESVSPPPEPEGAAEDVTSQPEPTPEPSTAASTPGSEGFVHLAAGGGEEGGATCGDAREVSETPASTPSELRQRRLAFYTAQRTDREQAAQGASVDSPGAREAERLPEAAPTERLPDAGHTERLPEAAPAERLPEAAPTERLSEAAHAERLTEADTFSEPSASQTDSTEGFTHLDGHIRIRIKYLDDRQRWVQARPEETVGQFKRTHFRDELSENSMIRCIYNGRELSRDGESLASYNVSDESVIHCLVSHVTSARTDEIPRGVVQFDVGSLVFPLFGLILGLIWYSRFTYKQYFNTMSTLMLIGISFLFVVALLASFRNQDAPETVEAD